MGSGGGLVSRGGSGLPWPRRGRHAARRSAFQNKIVDRCERLQLQSAAITRHVDEVLPAKDQAVLVSPGPIAPRGVERRWPHVLLAELPSSWGAGGWAGVVPLPTLQLEQVECQRAPAIPASSASNNVHKQYISWC